VTGQKIKHYEVRELIGRGAMGAVYRAYDRALDREVAVKFLATEAAPTPAEMERFYREARAAAGLTHPNIVVIHDVGEHAGTCYFVMELLSGGSLRQRLQEGLRCPWREGLRVVLQVCQALEAAHARGLLHRDIKPDNVWVLPDGHVKVLDFGIAHFSTAQTLTQADEMLGTPEYMAPEQIMGEKLDGRTDLYALGILMYETFTGQLPFSGPNAVTVIYKQMEQAPTPPSHLSRDLPVAVEKIILKAMAKDPGRRYDSAAQMRGEVEALLKGGDVEGVEKTEAPQRPERPGRAGRREAFEPRLVGRDEELEGLRGAVRGLEGGQGGAVLIGGEAGIGKTRIASEALDYARRRGALTLEGVCLYSEGPEPYLPFIEALGRCLELRESERHPKLLAFIQKEAPELEELTSRLVTAIRTRRGAKLVDPEATIATSKERLFEAITQVLLFLSEETPVVLLLDDLQWADSGSLQLLHYITRSAQERRLLILGTYRTEDLLPEEEGASHPLADTLQRMSREGLFRGVELKGLGPEEVNLMLRFVFERAVFSEDFRASLYRETGGNPFFVIEVLKLLRDEGVIFERRGIWREQREITRADIPDRVYDVVARRVERLTDAQRELLQIAAVAGERFTSEALAGIADERRVRVLQALSKLERVHQLIRSEGDAYLFSHAKIREVLYDEISPELRREYHLAYGNYLEGRAAVRKGESVADLAHHFYRGGAPDKALPYLVRAGDRAGRVFAYREARDCYRWALEVLPGAGGVRDRSDLERVLLYRLGLTYNRLGEAQESLDHFQRAEALAEQSGDHRAMAEIQRRIGLIQARAGQYDQAARRYRQSVENFRRAGDRKALCEVLVNAANIPFEQGDWKRVQAYYDRALRIARQVGDRRQTAAIYMSLGIMASIRGEADRALELYEESRVIYEEVKDWYNLASLYLNQGWSYAGLKAWDKAQVAYEKALAISRKTRNIFRESDCYLNLAEVLLATSDLKGSKRVCLKALEIFKKVDNRLGMADALKTLGQVATAERRWEEGRSYFEKSISANEALRNPLGAGRARLEYARMLKECGDLGTAGGELGRAIAWFEKIEAREDLKTAQDLRKEIESLRYLALA